MVEPGRLQSMGPQRVTHTQESIITTTRKALRADCGPSSESLVQWVWLVMLTFKGSREMKCCDAWKYMVINTHITFVGQRKSYDHACFQNDIMPGNI